MSKKPHQRRINEKLGNLEPTIIDPRAFLDGTANLWDNPREGYRQPVMYGNIVVPKRMIDFAWENTEPLYHKGERCISLSVSYWESIESNYHSTRPPIYTGKTKLYLDSLRSDVAEQVRQAYKLTKARNL